MPPLRYFVVDAFTDRPFAGNPAAVVPLSEWRDDAWLQNVAMEMNLSETAFLVTEGDGYRLRWFTPKTEVALCGHATLASAHVLWNEGYALPDEEIRFQTKSGLLKAARKELWIELDFPVKPPTESSPPPGLLEALGTSAKYVGRNQFPPHPATNEAIQTTQQDDGTFSTADLIATYENGIEDLRTAVSGMSLDELRARPIAGK